MNQRKYAKVGGAPRGKTGKKALRVRTASGKETAEPGKAGLSGKEGAAGMGWKDSAGSCVCGESRGRGSLAGSCVCGENRERGSSAGSCVCGESRERGSSAGSCVCGENRGRGNSAGSCVCERNRGKDNSVGKAGTGAEMGRKRSVCVAWDGLDEAGGRLLEKSEAVEEAPMSWEDWAELPLEGYDEDLAPDRDRAFTRQTVYLVHKWLAEGMPLPMVARMLNRSVENVQAAAKVPLLKGEKALMRRYFFPFRMRKETE